LNKPGNKYFHKAVTNLTPKQNVRVNYIIHIAKTTEYFLVQSLQSLNKGWTKTPTTSG